MLRGNKSFVNKEAVSTEAKKSSNDSDFAINFKKLHKNSQILDLEKFQQKKLIDRFLLLSKYKWGELQLQKGSRQGQGHGYKRVDISSLSTSINDEGNTEILSFSIDDKFRMFGFREENIFYPVVLDPNHKEHNK